MTQAHLSPDEYKLLIVDEARKVMQLFFLHDKDRLQDRTKIIPLEEDRVSIQWF